MPEQDSAHLRRLGNDAAVIGRHQSVVEMLVQAVRQIVGNPPMAPCQPVDHVVAGGGMIGKPGTETPVDQMHQIGRAVRSQFVQA